MLIDEEVGVQNGISKLADFACFGVFSAVLRVTNDDFCPRTIPPVSVSQISAALEHIEFIEKERYELGWFKINLLWVNMNILGVSGGVSYRVLV